MRSGKSKADRLSFNELVEKVGRIRIPRFIRRLGVPMPKLPLWLMMPLKSFNFLLFHYLYLIFMSIIGSIVIYPGRTMPYVDALFFAAGSATQSGLNTYVLWSGYA